MIEAAAAPTTNIAERVVAFIQENDPFGDRFTQHDIDQIDQLAERAAQRDELLAALKRVQGFLLIDGDPPGLVTIEGDDESSVVEIYQEVSAAIARAEARATGGG